MSERRAERQSPHRCCIYHQAPDWWKTGRKLLGIGSIVVKMAYKEHETVDPDTLNEVVDTLLPLLRKRLEESRNTMDDIKFGYANSCGVCSMCCSRVTIVPLQHALDLGPREVGSGNH